MSHAALKIAPGVPEPQSLFRVDTEARPTGLLRPEAQRWKRLFDIAAATVLGLLALPVAVLIAIAIKLDSPGPVFFRHTRIGRGHRRFRLWKFRSMVSGADEVLRRHLEADAGVAAEWLRTHKLKDDPRVTRVGRWLRRTSLDELPQIWNVLRGDMSLIGPRPIVEAEIPRYQDSYFLYTRVAPGLTGLWQVSGRNDTSYRRRVELDRHYILNWTPGMDLRILLRTLPVVLIGRGAY